MGMKWEDIMEPYDQARAAIRRAEGLMGDNVPPDEVQTLFLQGITHALCALVMCMTREEIDA